MKTIFGDRVLIALTAKVLSSNGFVSTELKQDCEDLLPILQMIANANAPVNIKELLEAELKELKGE